MDNMEKYLYNQTKNNIPIIINSSESIKDGIWTGAKGISSLAGGQTSVSGIVSGFPFTKVFKLGMDCIKGQACFLHTDGFIYSTDAIQASMVTGYIGIITGISSRRAMVQSFGITGVLKNLTAQSTYYLSNATQTQDIAYDSNNTSYTLLNTSEVNYQSFTTNSTTSEISSVQLKLLTGGGTANRPITIKIRVGTGIGGGLLGSGTFTPSINATPAYYTCILDVPIAVLANTVYSITATYSTASGSGTPGWDETNPGAYSGGTNENSRDYGFKTFYSTGRGAIGTSAGTVSKIVGFATDVKSLTIKDTLP